MQSMDKVWQEEQKDLKAKLERLQKVPPCKLQCTFFAIPIHH